MSGHTVLVTGAGFSKPAGGPLLPELLSKEYLEKSDAADEILDALVALAAETDKRESTISVEDLFTSIWRMARTGGSFQIRGQTWTAEDLLNAISVHLISVCGAIHLRRGTKLWESYGSFLDELLRGSKSLSIVTFNYDLLTEQLLDDLHWRFTYAPCGVAIEFEDDRRRKRLRHRGTHVKLLKLHGSVNWGVCRGCNTAKKGNDFVTAFESPYNPPPRKRRPWCGARLLEPGIIPPISGKAGELRHMDALWRAAREALSRAREIIIVGYSLPATDHEAVSLMKEIEWPGKRPRIRIVCGPHGAPDSYSHVLSRYEEVKMYFEDYLADQVS